MKKISVTCERKEDIALLKEAGADEVIVALEGGVFSSLHTFSIAQIEELLTQAHLVQIQLFVLMNRLFPQSEIKYAQQELKQLLEIGVDGVIIADPGLYQVAKELSLEDKLIYSPETLVTSAEDAKFWLSTGMYSVNISPLLTEEEILKIASSVRHCGIQVFGYLLMSISKRPLLTAYQEVANIEEPLHHNHHLYLREQKRDGMMPAYENEAGMMIYTDFVQESFAWLEPFSNAGIQRFEMYGNYIPQDALLDAIRMYRRVLDGRWREC
ncbi:MAG: U32 family peptidase [Solobacterium sp.]|nr:U32 family peptidase [Solobacterium sp.]